MSDVDEEEAFTATGPVQSQTDVPFTAFCVRSLGGWEYGLNAIGRQAGALGMSVAGGGAREAPWPGIGGCFIGDSFGVYASSGARGIAGLLALQHGGRPGVLAATLRDGIGVAGISLRGGFGSPGAMTTLPPGSGAGIGVLGRSGSAAGVQGESSTGTGVHGRSRTAAGVHGEGDEWVGVLGTAAGAAAGVRGEGSGSTGVEGSSRRARGAVFASATAGDEVVAQLNLVPHPMAAGRPVTVRPTMQDPATLTLPAAGLGGDLLVTRDPDGRCTLWFCARDPAEGRPAEWREVLLGQSSGVPVTEVLWAGVVREVVGGTLPDETPSSLVGPPDGTVTVIRAGTAITLAGFRPTPVTDLRRLFTPATLLPSGDVVGPTQLDQADVVAFERNGSAPAPGGGWESCGWSFSDGVRTVAVEWNGAAGAPRDPHVVANGSIHGAEYAAHFGIDPHGAQAVPATEVISFLMLSLPELAVGPELTVQLRGTDLGDGGSPDVDAIGLLR